MRPTLFALLSLALACGDRASTSRDAAATMTGVQLLSAPVAETPPPGQPASAPASTPWSTQKLIRSAELQIQVRDVAAALRAADSIAQSRRALVADSRTTQDEDGKRTAEVLLRVPSTDFAALLSALRGVGTITSESIGTEDVTKAYADLETRLAVKEQTVARLRTLLDTRAARLADILAVERELDRAVAELEQMKGERRYYDQRVALSTVRLTLFERVPSQSNQISKPIKTAIEGAARILGTSVGALIYLVVAILPWMLLVLGVLWLVPAWRRRFLSRRSGNHPPTA